MYALIHNNQIQVGPRQWTWSFFKDYLDEENLDSAPLPRQDPGAVVYGDKWRIVPVIIDALPLVDAPYEQLAGPFLTINEDSVTGCYSTAPVAIESIKNTLKAAVTTNRYITECSGIEHTLQDGTTVKILTDRENRKTYVDAYSTLADGQHIIFKFPNAVFKTITKQELGTIVGIGANHVRSVFEWEANKYMEIDAAIDNAGLKIIELRHPNQIEG